MGVLRYGVSAGDLLRIREALVTEGWGPQRRQAVAGLDRLLEQRAERGAGGDTSRRQGPPGPL